MSDWITYCDVCECAECQRYGDDCDGDKRNDDLISRADAMGAVQDHFNANGFKGYDDGQKMMDRINALPSAEAEPTVIRSKTLFPTKDFMEWAKRIKEVNPNGVVIPCDAEVVSAEAVQGEWILVKGSNGKDYHKCSKCLHTQEITGVKNYCAVCGARMKGGGTE